VAGEQFRSIGDRSARADLRAVKPGEIPTAPQQTDADAPDTTPDRVFPQSDPKVLNKTESVRASDRKQATDLDAPPRRLGGNDVTDELAYGTGLGPGLKNTTEVQVQPSPKATAVRQAREQDMQRATEKRRAAEGITPMKSSGDMSPAGTEAMSASTGSKATVKSDSVPAVQGEQEEDYPRVRVQFGGEFDARINSLRERAAMHFAESDAIANDPRFLADDTGDYAARRMEAYALGTQFQRQADAMEQMKLRLSLGEQSTNAQLRMKAMEMQGQNRKVAADERVGMTQVERQFPLNTLASNVQDFGETVRALGPTAAALNRTTNLFNQDGKILPAPNDPTFVAQRQGFEQQAASIALGQRLSLGKYPRPGDPLVDEIGQIVRGIAPNDPAMREQVITRIVNAAATESRVSPDSARKYASLLIRMIEAGGQQ
jgi:hypothetical protein